MKTRRKAVFATVAALIVALLAAVGLAACGGNREPNGKDPEISAEYRAIYDVYKAEAGADALAIDEWYSALKTDIDEIPRGGGGILFD